MHCPQSKFISNVAVFLSCVLYLVLWNLHLFVIGLRSQVQGRIRIIVTKHQYEAAKEAQYSENKLKVSKNKVIN